MIFIAVAVALAGAGLPGTGPAGDPDLASLLIKAQEAQSADFAAWREFRFRREARRETLDSDGRVSETEDLDFRVSPEGAGFDEELIRIDGRSPTRREVDRYRRIGKFGRHYQSLITGGEGGGSDGGVTLGRLLRLTSYRYAGRENLEGVPCHRLDFDPSRPGAGGGIEARVGEALAGSLWITEEGFHLMMARAATIRPVSVAFSLSKVHSLKLEMKSGPVTPDIWLPRRIEVETQARVLIAPIHRRSRYLYSEFEPAGR